MNRMKCTSHVLMTSAMLAAVTVGVVRPASAQHEGHQMTGQKPPVTPGTTTAGAAVSPTPVWQISGPAEAAVQAFQDAMQVGNRELATRWLSPEVTIVASGVTDPSREAYASRRMGLDMAFLKSSRVVLLDRQVQQDADSARVVSSARITGRDGDRPVDVLRTEVAQLARTNEGWRVVRLEWSAEPAASESTPMDHSKMDHSTMPMGATPGAKPATGAKPSAPAAMDHSKMDMGTPAKPAPAKGAKPASGTKPSTPPPMDHSKMDMGTAADTASQATDPVCGLKVDPASAPQGKHGGQTYFFCSEQHRDLFQKTPVKYLPKGR